MALISSEHTDSEPTASNQTNFRLSKVRQITRSLLRDSLVPALTPFVVISLALIWLDQSTSTPNASSSVASGSAASVQSATSNQSLQNRFDQAIELQRLSIEIVRDREMMQLALRTYVTTDAITTDTSTWKERYDLYATSLVSDLDRLSALTSSASEPFSAGLNSVVREIQQAAFAAAEIEQSALAHIRAGRFQQANDLLLSDRYQMQQEIFMRGVQRLSVSVGQAFELPLIGERAVQAESEVSVSKSSLGRPGTVAAVLLAIAWLAMLFRINHDSARRQKAEKQLKQNKKLLEQRHQEISASRATLLEKNTDLEDTLLELQETKSELERSHQNVQVSRAALSQKADTLEKAVSELQATKSQLALSHRSVQISRAALAQKAATLEQTLDDLQQAQMQVIQSEKMSSLGQLVAGIAHEVNNPVNFIYANLEPMQDYTADLLAIVKAAQQHCDHPQIKAAIQNADLPFVQEDLPKLLDSMSVGTERIRQIVISLQNFSRSDESGRKATDLHEGIESSLLIVQHRLNKQPDRGMIEVIRDYGDIPLVECYPGLINQVYMNLLANAIDAIEEKSERNSGEKAGSITLRTSAIERDGQPWVEVAIADTGAGIPEAIAPHVFDAFFTTKPVGKGTGIGLAVSYTIVKDKHSGELVFSSTPDRGTEFKIRLPVETAVASTSAPLFSLQPPLSSMKLAGQAVEFVL